MNRTPTSITAVSGTCFRLLIGQGFTEAELKKIAARIAQETGADIIFC